MDIITVLDHDEVHVKLDAERGIVLELSEYFTFFIKDAHLNPKVQARIWDGRIRLFNLKSRLIYKGLLNELEKFAKSRSYKLVYETEPYRDEFSINECDQFVETLKLPFKIHDHQRESFITAIRDKRNLTLSPTSSGKSLIIYMMFRYHKEKTLIIVPTTGLVEQMANDFKGYGFDSDKFCHLITAGKDKDSPKPIIISTWQSIYELPESWFNQFKVIIGDEVHGFKAKSLKEIMEKATGVEYRYGLTGTLDDCEIHELVLKGLFGPIRSFVTTKDLMDQNIVAQLNIEIIILKHNVSRKLVDYQDELSYVLASASRNNFIKNLALSLDGNVLILFHFSNRENHGHELYRLINEASSKKHKVHFINGTVKGTDREAIRPLVESSTDNIIVASFATFQTGVSIKNIQHVILASPRKTKIGTLQSIGRGLRISETKKSVTLFDIGDNLVRSRSNTILEHLIRRIEIYEKEHFNYKIYKVQLKDEPTE